MECYWGINEGCTYKIAGITSIKFDNASLPLLKSEVQFSETN